MRIRSSFTLIEVIVVIVIIGILAFSLNFKFFDNNLQIAADKLIRDIRFTQSLALKDDKYQAFPEHLCDGSTEGKIECNKSKYWFKQWWQLRFKISNGSYLYSIFSDSPKYNSSTPPFNLSPNYVEEYALNPLTSKYTSATSTTSTYAYSEYNLSKYNIKLIIRPNGNPYDSTHYNPALTFVFDNYGNVYLKEGSAGDAGDINPLDKDKRKLITSTKNIKLCLDNPCVFTKERCVQINITPTGFVYKSTCN